MKVTHIGFKITVNVIACVKESPSFLLYISFPVINSSEESVGMTSVDLYKIKIDTRTCERMHFRLFTNSKDWL